ncbi:MAG: hypothetical protein JNL11_14450 [Bdellovibrionaceae bacterium]|nr:hypothetical protein [Pseudobdellovibrionaceae bacterium]
MKSSFIIATFFATIFGLSQWCFGAEGDASTKETQWEKDYGAIFASYETCLDGIKDTTAAATTVGTAIVSNSRLESRSKSCALKEKVNMEIKRKNCAKITECKDYWDDQIAQFSAVSNIVDRKEERRQTRCENRYNDDQEIYTDCKGGAAARAKSCTKFNKNEDTGFLDSDNMKSMAPMLGMVNGANVLLDMYSTMNSNPSCSMSKEDFLNQKDKLETKASEIEDKIRDLRQQSEEAQADYTKQLEEWADREREIADRLTELPQELSEKERELIKERTKVKMEADQKYQEVSARIAETSRKINEVIDARKVAVAGKSMFSIHDLCAEKAVGGDPEKNKSRPQASTAVQSSFANAYAQGKALKENIQSRYNNCVKSENAVLSQTTNAYERALSTLKDDVLKLQSSYGDIAKRKEMADKDLEDAIRSLKLKGETEAAKLRNEYLVIQQKKQAAQANLKTKLERLSSDSQKQTQKLAVLEMQIRQYQGKPPAANSKGLSMGDLAAQCGESYQSLLTDFKKTCCDVEGFEFTGTGNSVCRIKTEAENKAAADAAAEAKKKKKSSTTK